MKSQSVWRPPWKKTAEFRFCWSTLPASILQRQIRRLMSHDPLRIPASWKYVLVHFQLQPFAWTVLSPLPRFIQIYYVPWRFPQTACGLVIIYKTKIIIIYLFYTGLALMSFREPFALYESLSTLQWDFSLLAIPWPSSRMLSAMSGQPS